jgi:hypothetical protein
VISFVILLLLTRFLLLLSSSSINNRRAVRWWRRRPASIISSTSRFYLVSHSTHLAETHSLGLHTSYLLTNKEREKESRERENEECLQMCSVMVVVSDLIELEWECAFFILLLLSISDIKKKMLSDLVDDDLLTGSLTLPTSTLTKTMVNISKFRYFSISRVDTWN